MQANAPPGVLAAELEVGSNFQHVVHQASGMVAVQLRVRLVEVADDVVKRRVRFEHDA